MHPSTSIWHLHFNCAVLQDTVKLAVSYLNGDGPPDVCSIVRDVILTPRRSALKETIVIALPGLGDRLNTLCPWSPVLLHQLHTREPFWLNFVDARGRDCDMYQGTVTETSATAANVIFQSQQGTEQYTLRDTKDHVFVLQLPGIAIQLQFFCYPELAAIKLLQKPQFLQPFPDKPPAWWDPRTMNTERNRVSGSSPPLVAVWRRASRRGAVIQPPSYSNENLLRWAGFTLMAQQAGVDMDPPPECIYHPSPLWSPASPPRSSHLVVLNYGPRSCLSAGSNQRSLTPEFNPG